MPQDAGPDTKGEAEIAAAARLLMQDASSEPVPDRILELAQQLEAALAEGCKRPATARKPR